MRRTDYTPDTKPAPRIIDDRAGRAKLRAEGRCRVCGRRPGQPIFQPGSRGKVRIGTALRLSRHHIVPKGQGGDDVDSNIAPVCGSGTTGCHGLIESRAKGVRQALGLSLTEDERAYVVGRKSEAWLIRHYGVDAAGCIVQPPDEPSAPGNPHRRGRSQKAPTSHTETNDPRSSMTASQGVSDA